MKTWTIFLAVIAMLNFPANALAAPQEPGSAPSFQPIVHIVHTQKQDKGNLTYIHSSSSVGTVIGPHLILTHNHFGVAFGTLPDETLDIRDRTGRSFQVRVAEVKRIAIDRGTLLLRLPDTIDLTALPFADQAAISHLSAGDWLTVNYWDDARQRLATKDFKFIRMANGIATLSDPDHTINPGDSGGGVFFDGRLIGNTWSYNADTNGNALGSFNVALLPPQVATMQ
jgi:hypothetical protein